MLCELCEKNKGKQKHHVIPKCIIKKVNVNSKLRDNTVMLCEHCHRHVHYAYINHLIHDGDFTGYNRMNAIKYTILKDFLKKYKKVEAHWKVYWKDFLDNSMEEFMKED